MIRFVENKEKEDEGIKTDTKGMNHGKQNKQAQKHLYEEINYYDNIVTLRKIPSIISRNGYSSARIVDIEFDGKPMALYCYLKLMGNP